MSLSPLVNFKPYVVSADADPAISSERQTRSKNLIALCPHHHRLHHRGLLGITGNADELDGVTVTNQYGNAIAQTGAEPEHQRAHHRNLRAPTNTPTVNQYKPAGSTSTCHPNTVRPKCRDRLRRQHLIRLASGSLIPRRQGSRRRRRGGQGNRPCTSRSRCRATSASPARCSRVTLARVMHIPLPGALSNLIRRFVG